MPDSASEAVAMTVGILTILAMLLAGVIWLVKSQIAQTKNIGANGRSVIDHLEELRDIVRDMDRRNTSEHNMITARLEHHIDNHPRRD